MAGGYVDPGNEFALLLFLPPILLWVAAAVWVTWDSFQRTGEWGLLWGFFAFVCAPVVFPLYLICTFIADRPAPAWVQREKELEKEAVRKMRGMNEFERVKYLENAAAGGTMYSDGGLQPHNRGVKHFEDAEAEQLLRQHEDAAAFVYLYDLYALATEDADVRGEETYRHYIAQLPGGLPLLQRARERRVDPAELKARGMALLDGPAPDATPAVEPASGGPDGSLTSVPAPRAPLKPLSIAAPTRPHAPPRPTVPF